MHSTIETQLICFHTVWVLLGLQTQSVFRKSATDLKMRKCDAVDISFKTLL